MYIYLAIALAGLTVCGLLVLRHAVRHAPLAPADKGTTQPLQVVTPVDRLQRDFRVDTRTDYPSEPMRQLLRKLKTEEVRQRPQEGRN